MSHYHTLDRVNDIRHTLETAEDLAFYQAATGRRGIVVRTCEDPSCRFDFDDQDEGDGQIRYLCQTCGTYVRSDDLPPASCGRCPTPVWREICSMCDTRPVLLGRVMCPDCLKREGLLGDEE